jgi:GT2 family glycosyltransferase
MRHRIALKLDDFRATPEGFERRPKTHDRELLVESQPFFSIVIPNYNGMNLLPPLMEALDRQTFGDFEVILVDDASNDRSVAWLEERHSDVRVIVNRRNEGFDRSCNTGAAASRGRIIVILNSDTEPEPDWLRELATAVTRNPESSLFASKVLLFDHPDTLNTTGDAVGTDGIPINRGVWERDRGQYDEQLEVFGASGCALAVRRELWEALGGFDEDYWMYLEDVDFAYRAQLLGAQSRFVPKARILHRLTATAGGPMASYFVGRNTLWMIAKNTPDEILLQNFLGIVAAQARIAVEAVRSFRGAAARARLAGQAIGLLTLWRVLPKRRIIQRQRRIDVATLRTRMVG